MPIERIDHVNVAAADLDTTRRFYRDVLGLSDGPRPPFQRPGAWMYLHGHPAVHISTGRIPKTRKSDAINHVAFAATGLVAMRETLRDRGLDFLEVGVPDAEQLQIFLHDPDGNEIELIYSGDEARAALLAGVPIDATALRP
ncbi:MAG: VOC family protein [Lautropia sp.]